MAFVPPSTSEEVRQWVMAATDLADRVVEDHAVGRAAAADAADPAALERWQRWLEAERMLATQQLRQVLDDRWWTAADAVAISGAWAAARTWSAHHDPTAHQAADRIRAELRQRYSIDLPEVEGTTNSDDGANGD